MAGRGLRERYSAEMKPVNADRDDIPFISFPDRRPLEGYRFLAQPVSDTLLFPRSRAA